MILEGRARGGPLDGVKVTAGSAWDGRIQQIATGRYVWDPALSGWRWVDGTVKRIRVARPGGD